VKIIVRTIRERTADECIRRAAQIGDVDIVHQFTPFCDALRETYRRGMNYSQEWVPVIDADVLLYDGVADADGSRSYNGLAGDDVLQMRNNEDLDFNDLPDISNIEVLDMSNDTANEVRNLSPEDVLDITDGDNKLFIDADGYDSVLGEPGSTWTQEADQSIGGTTYEVYSATVSTAGGPETVTLYVDNEATISL